MIELLLHVKMLSCIHSNWFVFLHVQLLVVLRKVVLHDFVFVISQHFILLLDLGNLSLLQLGNIARVVNLPFCSHSDVVNIVVVVDIGSPAQNFYIFARNKTNCLIRSGGVDVVFGVVFGEAAEPTGSLGLAL